MKKKPEIEHADAFLWLEDLPPSPAPVRFAADEMPPCPKCARRSAPTRLNCLYCGEKLPVSEAQSNLVRPTLRALEVWEKGWNAVYLPGENDNFDERTLGDFLRLEPEEAVKFASAHHALPVARAASPDEAEVVARFFRDKHLKIEIVSDADLNTEVLPARVRGMEFGTDKLILQLLGKNESVEIFTAQIELIIVGTIFERRVENRENRKNVEKIELKDSTEISSDESLIDFYISGDPNGFRISARNFDFSCLGANKKLLAHENFEILLQTLKQTAQNAVFDVSYKKARAALNVVWQPEQRTEARGWQREGIGRINLDSRLTISNQTQFLRYSRLLNLLR